MALKYTRDGNITVIYGKSSDVKPIDSSIENGSVFYEMDTGNVYMFDIEDHNWILQ